MKKLSLLLVIALIMSLSAFALADSSLDGVYRVTEYTVTGDEETQAVLDLVLGYGEMYVTIGGGNITLSMTFMGESSEEVLGTFAVQDSLYCLIGGELALYTFDGATLTLVDNSGKMVMEYVGAAEIEEQGLRGIWTATAVVTGDEETQSAFDLILTYGSITLEIGQSNLVMDMQVLGTEQALEYSYIDLGELLYLSNEEGNIIWNYTLTNGVLTITTGEMVMTLER